MAALVPGFSVEPAALDELEVGVAWTDAAEPLVRERVEGAAALFPHRRALEFPEPVRTGAAFMRDVAAVHRELFEEHAELYGTNVRTIGTNRARTMALPPWRSKNACALSM